MKSIVQLFFLLVSNYCYAQKLTDITSYYHSTDKENGIIHFKVKNNSFAFTTRMSKPDSTQTLFIGKNHQIICPKDSMQMLEVYNERYLFISYYPILDARLAYGVEFRPKDRFLIIDLKNPEKRWLYYLKNMVKTKNIQMFNPKSGELTINWKILPQSGSSTKIRISTSK